MNLHALHILNDRLQKAIREEDLGRVGLACHEMITEVSDIERRMVKEPETKTEPMPPAPQTKLKQYLGGSVYADIEGGMVVLTTENGIETSNTIYLEPGVIQALDRYIKWVKEVRG